MDSSKRNYRPMAGMQTSPAKLAVPLLTCPQCGGTWLEEKKVNQYRSGNLNIVGSRVVALHDHDYYIMVCIQCGTPVEQPLQFFGVDLARENHADIIATFKKRAEACQAPEKQTPAPSETTVIENSQPEAVPSTNP